MKTSPLTQKDARYDAMMDEIRQAHRERVADEMPSDARWAALAAATHKTITPQRASGGFWFRPALALCVVALAVGGIVAYDAGLERGADPHVARATATHGPGLWHATTTPLTLAFAGGHTAELASDAILDVASATQSQFDARVTRGGVTFAVSPRAADDLFRVRFGANYLEVRGTKFVVNFAEGPAGPEASVAVEHGVVEVFAAGKSVFIRAGEVWVSEATAAVASAPVWVAAKAPAVGASTESTESEAATTPEPEEPAALHVALAEPANVAVRDDARQAPKPETGKALRDAPPVRTPKNKDSRKTEVVQVPPQESPIVGVEPLSPAVEQALLLSMKTGGCARVERALAAVIRAQGGAAPGEAWWMRGWCARSRGDGPTSVRFFEKARGKARWAIPDATTLPPVPSL